MKYLSFRIRNFKGIVDTTLHLTPKGAGVFTLIGLNESGKTSVLEAINLFQPDNEYTDLVSPSPATNSTIYESYIPKKFQANFSNRITVAAEVQLDAGDREAIMGGLGSRFPGTIDPSSLPDKLTVTKALQFEDSEFKKLNFELSVHPKLKPIGARKFVELPFPSELWHAIARGVTLRLPKILYFPTFLFSIPSRIVLNPPEPEDSTNAIYRQILNDVAASLPNKVDIQKHVVARMTGKVPDAAKTATGVVVLGNPRQAQAAAALNDLSVHISSTVFEEWQKVLGARTQGREISLQPGIELSPDGPVKVFVQFMMKEGQHYYDISERSLGFRWFFSFLLFTVYRSVGSRRGATVFLLDEPASNLHPKAQAQLLESFPKIASGDNILLYSTHSHYMVEPKWLEQASIISNSAIDRSESEDEGRGTFGRNATDVAVTRYRRFVGEHPDKVTYFQPVLDQLDYAMSAFDYRRPTMLVEGKGDYAYLEYVRRVIHHGLSEIAIMPTRGATGMDELIGLLLGWAVPFCVCLDDDKEGRLAVTKYRREWGLPEHRVFTYGEIDVSMSGFRIENLLTDDDIALVKQNISEERAPTKDEIRLFFAEKLATGERVSLSSEMVGRADKVLSRACESLGVEPSLETR